MHTLSLLHFWHITYKAPIHLPDSIMKSSYSRTGGFLGGIDFTACAIALHMHISTNKLNVPHEKRLSWLLKLLHNNNNIVSVEHLKAQHTSSNSSHSLSDCQILKLTFYIVYVALLSSQHVLLFFSFIPVTKIRGHPYRLFVNCAKNNVLRFWNFLPADVVDFSSLCHLCKLSPGSISHNFLLISLRFVLVNIALSLLYSLKGNC